MSWKATAWAKETKGHGSYAQHLILHTLADYHDAERNEAWPAQATLGHDNEMPIRTVRWCLVRLARMGFIRVKQKGNQYQPTRYVLNFDVVTPQLREPAKSGPARVASAGAVAKRGRVQRQQPASEPASAEPPNLQEPPIEPPTPSQEKEDKGKGNMQKLHNTPEDRELWPEWYTILRDGIPAFTTSLYDCETWLAKKGRDKPWMMDMEYRADTARALVSQWAKLKRTHPWLTYQVWVKRTPLQADAPQGPSRRQPGRQPGGGRPGQESLVDRIRRTGGDE